MAKNERTSSRVAKKAGATLSDAKASKSAKSLAGSALAQAGTRKTTSAKVAQKAAKVLTDPHRSGTTRSLAGSVLTQAAGSKKAVKKAAGSGTTSTGPKGKRRG